MPDFSQSQTGAAQAPADPPQAPAIPDTPSLKRADRSGPQRDRNARFAPIIPEAVPWRAVVIFLLIAFGLSWLVTLPLYLSGDGLAHPLFMVIAAVMMYTPAVAAFVVVLFVRRPRSIPRLLGLAPLRPLWRTAGLSAIALVGFPLLAFLAMLLGQAMGLIRLDLVNFSGFTALLEANGVPDLTRDTVLLIVIAQVAFIPLNAVFSSIAAFGEEIGWRGWLLPNLLPLGTWPALVLSGAVWGLWHTPLILLGYNYGLADVRGVLLMVGWCVLLGILIGWLRLRSASVWPSVFAHGAVNAATSALAIAFVAVESTGAAEPDPAIFGTILGWSGWIVLAVAILLLQATGQLRKRAEPGLTLAESRS
ncbi:MAG: CPBP family intramembrane metalloprotease [Burkholderiaceae bacterium]|nr:CPBP family intramembrane metalloprotease [Microbacteriaceae bacterium]